MDCFFHSNVPSVTRCAECRRPVCGTCRDAQGTCPSCRLAERIDAAAAARPELSGGVRRGPGPGPSWGGTQANASAGTSARRYNEGTTAVATVSPETRALVALGYPFWPLAAVALLDPKRSPYIRRQATQALAFSLGFTGMTVGLTAIAHIPILGISAWWLLPLLAPIYIVASVVYGFKAWRGDDVRVPLVSDWLDQRWPEGRTATEA